MGPPEGGHYVRIKNAVGRLLRVAKSDVVQAFRPARRGGPEGPHYICNALRSALPALRFHVDGELLAFLVQMAALDAERPSRLGDAVPVGTQLGQHDLALEGGDPVGERAAARRRPARQLTS